MLINMVIKIHHKLDSYQQVIKLTLRKKCQVLNLLKRYSLSENIIVSKLYHQQLILVFRYCDPPYPEHFIGQQSAQFIRQKKCLEKELIQLKLQKIFQENKKIQLEAEVKQFQEMKIINEEFKPKHTLFTERKKLNQLKETLSQQYREGTLGQINELKGRQNQKYILQTNSAKNKQIEKLSLEVQKQKICVSKFILNNKQKSFQKSKLEQKIQILKKQNQIKIRELEFQETPQSQNQHQKKRQKRLKLGKHEIESLKKWLAEERSISELANQFQVTMGTNRNHLQ